MAMSGEAPASSSRRTAVCPRAAATCSGAQPKSSWACTLAPACSKTWGAQGGQVGRCSCPRMTWRLALHANNALGSEVCSINLYHIVPTLS